LLGQEATFHRKEERMPEKATLKRARRDKSRGKSPSTQAGEFVREEMHHVREGKHGARSTQQAIAIGLSKARRAGVDLPPPKRGTQKTKASARSAYARGHGPGKNRKPSPTRSKATTQALKREGHSAASSRSLSAQAHRAATRRGPKARQAAAKKAARTRASSRASR
jgi:Family of unknown function (DUF6496)